jgi:hypothetical protein
MRRVAFGAFALGANAVILWQLATAEPWLNPLVAGVLAAVLNLAVGLRIGYASAQAYVADVKRINQLVADQNGDLLQCNRELLARSAQLQADPVAPLREGRRA